MLPKPEDKYNFTPESLKIPGSDYKGVFTFAGQIKYVACVNCSQILLDNGLALGDGSQGVLVNRAVTERRSGRHRHKT
jgi:hypothetical protein